MIQWRRPFYAVSEAGNVERAEIVHNWGTVARGRLVESGATLQQGRFIVSGLTVIIRPSPRLYL
jgi:hypothetical protein